MEMIYNEDSLIILKSWIAVAWGYIKVPILDWL